MPHGSWVMNQYSKLRYFPEPAELTPRSSQLSLLVVASQIGKVALFTLTRLENGFSCHGPVVMLRLDFVLPFADQHRLLRPPKPLLGIAVSPQPSSEPWDARRSTRPRRWRLMLTYFDSSIMIYELSREENDELWII
jgi:hypothetical protein